MKRAMIAVLLFTALAGAAGAQTSHKSKNTMPLAISYAGNDFVGKSLVYELKNELAKSSVLEYNPDNEVGPILEMSSVSNQPGENLSSAISVVLLLKLKDQPYWYITHWTISLGTSRTSDQAKELLVLVDGELDHLRKIMQSSN